MPVTSEPDDGNHEAPPRRAVRGIEARAEPFGQDDERDHHQSDDRADDQRENEENFVFVSSLAVNSLPVFRS